MHIARSCSSQHTLMIQRTHAKITFSHEPIFTIETIKSLQQLGSRILERAETRCERMAAARTYFGLACSSFCVLIREHAHHNACSETVALVMESLMCVATSAQLRVNLIHNDKLDSCQD